MGRVSHTLDGEKLVRLRAARGLSQEQLAADAEVSKRTVERAEAGQRISAMNCARLAAALGVPIADLLDGTLLTTTTDQVPEPANPRRVSISRPVLLVSLAASAVIAILLVRAVGDSREPPPLDERRVVVFPFHVLDDASGDYLGRAFGEAISVNLLDTELSLAPVATDGEPPDRVSALLTIARNAGARYAVSGSLMRSGTEIEAQVVLRDAKDGRTVWGTTEEGADERLTHLAARVSAELAAVLGVQSPPRYDYWPHLGGGVEMMTSSELATTYGALSRGDFTTFQEGTRELVRRFPDEPDAYALRAYAMLGRYVTGFESREGLEQALVEAEAMDPRHPTPQCIRAQLAKDEGELDEAIERTNAIIVREDLTPAARAWALRIRAATKLSQRRLEPARYDVEQALRLDPTNHFSHSIIGRIHAAEGDTAAAIEAQRRSMALVPHDWGNYLTMTRLLVARGDGARPFRTRRGGAR